MTQKCQGWMPYTSRKLSLLGNGPEGTELKRWTRRLDKKDFVDMQALSHHTGFNILANDPGNSSRMPQEATLCPRVYCPEMREINTTPVNLWPTGWRANGNGSLQWTMLLRWFSWNSGRSCKQSPQRILLLNPTICPHTCPQGPHFLMKILTQEPLSQALLSGNSG